MARRLFSTTAWPVLTTPLVVFVVLTLAAPTLTAAQDAPADTLDAPAAPDSVRAVQQADVLKAEADSLLRNRQIDASIDVYRRAIAANEGLRRPRFHIRASYNLARALDDAGRPDVALTTLLPILEQAREMEWDPALARILSTTASMHRKMGAYGDALPLYEQALTVNRRLDRPFGLSVNHTNVGNIYFRQGRFNQALTSYEDALRTAKEAERPYQVALTLNNIGALYSHLGQREEALNVHLRALRYNRANDLPDAIAANYTNVGTLLARMGRAEDALRVLQQSLDLHQQNARPYDTEVTRMDVGSVQQMLGQYDEARAAFEQSLRTFRQMQRPDGVGDALINLGGLEAALNRPDAALRYYEEALATYRRVEVRPGEASALKGIGFVELDRGNAAAAIPPLEDAVSILETLRLNSTSPETRRSFHDTQVEAYQGLTLAHVRAGDARRALYVAEQSRARVLAERLARTSAPSVAPVDSLQQTIDPGRAAVVYANTASDTTSIAFVVTPTRVDAVLLPALSTPEPTHAAVDTVLAQFAEGFSNRTLTAARLEEQDAQTALAKTIQQYRAALVAPTERLRATRPAIADSVLARRDRLGRRLYDALVAPVVDAVGPETSFLVVPDGVLGFLPFETLRTPSGRYLIEDRHVRYAQSLNVLHLLQRRSTPVHRRDLLAFGGVTYDDTPPTRPLQRRGSRLDSLLVAAQDTSSRQPSVSSLTEDDSLLVQTVRTAVGPELDVRALESTTWGSLPGTDTEVRLLQRTVPDTDAFVRGAASEHTVRRMSETGQLSTYRWVHFATHGFVDPETPNLSALVLAGDRSGNEMTDGYLTMQEIADLDLQADVVTLSACQTGIGRLYGGEGVVSLAHAVFRAGARGTTVSLWNVVDGTTSDFMQRVYRRARLPNTSFAEAVTQAKRDFLRDPSRNAPLLWAPFVYYGPE